MSAVKLAKFDLYGTFRLSQDETVGIENLVQSLGTDEYLSRNENYYFRGLHFRDAVDEYARLRQMLPLDGKPAFVVCEKMHELAVRVVNTIQQADQVHLFQDGEHFDTVAQKCAQECADNLVRLLHHQTAEKTATNLRDETRLSPDQLLDYRTIFQDNKKQLYLCANALPADAEHLLTPGRGSSKLGTLVQAVRRHQGLKPLGFTQIYYSHYANDQTKVFPERLTNLPEKVLVMDDIIYRGSTLALIKKELTKQGHHVTNGAVVSAFYSAEYDAAALLRKANWADYIDIIPNQYAHPSSDQRELRGCLELCNWDENNGLQELKYLLSDPRNGDEQTTADYCAMTLAEEKAQRLGADLYQVSAKISPAAVAYNQKIRDQIVQDNAALTQ